MDDLIIYLKEQFEFEVVKKDKTSIVVRWEQSNADKFQKITKDILSELTTTSSIKIYRLGAEKQYQIYRLYFLLSTDLDSAKLKELYKIALFPNNENN